MGNTPLSPSAASSSLLVGVLVVVKEVDATPQAAEVDASAPGGMILTESLVTDLANGQECLFLGLLTLVTL